MRRKYGYLKRADCRLRLFCHRLTRKQRFRVTVTAFLLFTAACLYTIVSTLSGSGKTTIHLNSNIYENEYPKDERAAGIRK